MSEQDGTGLEQGGSDDASRQSKQSAQLGCCLARGSWTRRNVYQGRTNPILYEKGFGYVFLFIGGFAARVRTYAGKRQNFTISGCSFMGGVWYTRLSSTNRELYVEEDYYEYS